MKECYRQHIVDLTFLLMKHDNIEEVTKRFVRMALDIHQYEIWVNEEISIKEIEDNERLLIHNLIAIDVFERMTDNMRNACHRNLGSLELSVEVENFFGKNNIRNNIRALKQAFDEASDKLARWSEKILFTRESCMTCE